MTGTTPRERRELLWHLAGQALVGLTANPGLAFEIAGNGSSADVVTDAAWILATRMVARYEQSMEGEEPLLPVIPG